jgi:hypothetical protein
MVIEIINKLLLLLFFLSSLNVIRITYFFIQHWIDKEKFKLSGKSLFILGISIAYILLTIVSGIKL